MFQYTVERVKAVIGKLVQTTDNIEGLIGPGGQMRDMSSDAVNTLTMRLGKDVFVVSRYALHSLMDAVAEEKSLEERFVDWAKKRARANPAWTGWIMEDHVLRPIRNKQKITLFMSNGSHWDLSAKQVVEFTEAQELKEKLSVARLCEAQQKDQPVFLVPEKWNQGCYDVAMLRFRGQNVWRLWLWQITRGVRHTLKCHLAAPLFRAVAAQIKGTLGMEFTCSHVYVGWLIPKNKNDFDADGSWDDRTNHGGLIQRTQGRRLAGTDIYPAGHDVFKTDFHDICEL